MLAKPSPLAQLRAEVEPVTSVRRTPPWCNSIRYSTPQNGNDGLTILLIARVLGSAQVQKELLPHILTINWHWMNSILGHL